MSLRNGRAECRLGFLRLVLCSLLDTDTDAEDDDKFNIRLFASSWCESLGEQNPDRWNIDRDGETIQEVQVKMVEALICMNTSKRKVGAS